MGKAPCILLTDAEERSVVAACRALADAGFRVAAAAGTRLAPAHRASRFADAVLQAPSPKTVTVTFDDAFASVPPPAFPVRRRARK
jgi:hypothetical protein